MRFHKHVWRLHKKIDLQISKIRRHDHGRGLCGCDAPLIERAVVQIQIEWEQFVRTFVLDCATGRFEDQTGPITSGLLPNPANREKASNGLISLYKKRKVEPDWYRPDHAIQAAGKLGLSNLNTISSVLGTTPWLLDDLRHIRNFIVHQSKQAALEMRRTGTIATSDRIAPAQNALSYRSDGVKRYLGWSNFMKTISKKLV